ncbi:ribosome maturation factor RimP [Hazenella sp. IB182353]|uniref:ribosome maturation factor RimP n=1 Tax=Polycladospora coralii TaxID=2771432 RepID=UPI0017462381|nr:ribosome maturation factor RimP [Polycladospora coralii]MBS7530772.1 ribosome maturation factor RimP [Polycladospora coralii]
MSHQVVHTIEKAVIPILQSEQLHLVDVTYEKEGQNWFLRVFIERTEGSVDLDDCTRVSEKLSAYLDEQDPIQGAYILEVSSAGAERPLKNLADFQNAIGKNVYVTTNEPIDEVKAFEGILTAISGDMLLIEVTYKPGKKRSFEVPFSKIAKARLAIVF